MNCSLCNSKNVEMVDTEIRNNSMPDVNVYRCNDCGVHFLFPYYNQAQLENYYDGQYRTEYTDKDYYKDDQIKQFFLNFLPEAKERVKRVMPCIDKSKSILEIGCSSGYFLSEVAPYVKSASGTEWDESNAKFARDLGFIIKKNPSDFTYKFDNIFMFHVLEHIFDPIEFIAGLKQSLNADGTLFIEVPNNADILISGYELSEFKNFYYQSAHKWYFNKKSLAYILENAGFQFDIINIQRYDLSNHIEWLKNKVPGGFGKYNNILTDKINRAYTEMLSETDRSDTLFAICTVNKL